MFRYTLLIPALFFSVQLMAQLRDNSYRNDKNPLYWQNRKPDKAYWQQDVHCKINARINEETHVIEGSEELTYWNNSPDTLRYIYFHLYQNAFVKGSYLHRLEAANKEAVHLGRYEAEGKGIVINNLTVDNVAAATELDNTIMKVWLPKPLAPGGKVVMSMAFDSYYDRGSTRRRMQMYPAWGFMHYNGAQWFPKVAVYDRHIGWDTYQHMNREFYGEFGSFDVTLDFPSNYVVEATGTLQNRKETLPDTLLAKLDVKNFANKRWDEAPSVITPYEKGKRKIWHYRADNVHDFAFVADPSYRLDITYWKGIQCVGIVQEPHAAKWQTSAELVAKTVKTFSEEIGMYEYPKMVAADARDGMEYPMITMDGGGEPGYRGLLVHEIGHNWFYGMVGSNETYRASMDEGFTQYLTSMGLRKIDGDTMVMERPRYSYIRHFTEPTLTLDRNVLNTYSYYALNKEEVQLNTHSDDFSGALGHGGGYRGVYYKAATMLYNLEYVLGDSLFRAAMQHYFYQWKFAHPYYEDFRTSIIQFTKADLTWFFDQWFETTKTLDYKVGQIKKAPGMDNYAIRFNRKGEMQMPVDFTITAKDGHKQSYYIPNTWFSKQTEATTLPKWTGWGKLQEDYTAYVNVPSGIKHVQIDTTYRFADVNMMDNYKTRHHLISPKAVQVKLDGGINVPMNRRYYRMYIRPDLWWNAVDGIKAGVHFDGDYFSTLYKVDGTVWFNTHLLQFNGYKTAGRYDRYVPVNYTVNYLSPITRSMPKLQLQVNSRLLDGLWYHRAGFNWLVNDNNTVQLYGQSMWRQGLADRDYLLYPAEWSSTANRLNTSLNAAWTHKYNYVRGFGQYTFAVRAPLMNGNRTAAFDYSYAQLEAVNSNNLGKLVVHTRLFGRYGRGNNLPYESMLFLAGANPEELMDNKYTRSVGIVPTGWQGMSFGDVNHFQQGGGMNLRGYAGYLVPESGGLYAAYKSRSGIAGNIEIDVDNYIRLQPRYTRNWLKMNLYAFADAGIVELVNIGFTYPGNATLAYGQWSGVKMDAGIGTALTIRQWPIFGKAEPLTLRFDMPFFLSDAPGSSNFAFRYVVGVNRSF